MSTSAGDDQDDYQEPPFVVPSGGVTTDPTETTKSTIRTPFLSSGAEPVSDIERLRLRNYKLSVDNMDRIMANRQLGDNLLDRITTDGGDVRWLEICPTPGFISQLPNQRRYRFERVRGESTRFGRIYVPTGWRKHRDYLAEVSDLIPDNTTQEPALKVGTGAIKSFEQHWWVLDNDKAERASRDFTGFLRMPRGEVAGLFSMMLEDRGLWQGLHEDQAPTKQEEFDIRAAYSDARQIIAREYFEFRHVCETFDEEFLPQYRREDEKEFYLPFVACERDDLWAEFESRARERHSAHESQTVPEAIAAYERLADLVSVVIKPLLTAETVTGDPEFESNTNSGMVILWGTQETRYASTDELNDLRKWIDAVKRFLGLRRSIAQLLHRVGDAKKVADEWYPGSWDDLSVEELLIPVPGATPEAEQKAREILFGPFATRPEYQDVRPGPETGAWHLRFLAEMVDSVNALIEMARYSHGAIITHTDLEEKWIPKLARWNREQDLICGWWDKHEKRLYAEYDPAHPRRILRATHKDDWFTWVDWRWIMTRSDDYVFRQVAEYANIQFRLAGLEGVEMTIDGPNPNYFDFEGTARKLWHNQPAGSVIERLKTVWNREVDKGTNHIRPVYYKEVLSGLPHELLANLPTPDKEYVKSLRDKTSANLAAATDPDEKKQLQKNLSLLNRCLKRDARDLDELTKFIQKLNRDSDYRVREWSGFLSHSTEGGIRGFQVPEALGYIKEGYGADTGGPYEDLQATPVDLAMFAWGNSQFDKAVFLSRGLSYIISAKVDPMERHRAIGGAISAGLHPKIAYHVTEGFGGLGRYLAPMDEGGAAKYIQRIFEQKEIQQLGRKVVKELLEKELLRKEMRLQIINV